MSGARLWSGLVGAARLTVPVDCAGCGMPDRRWCETCEAPWWEDPRRCETSAARLDILAPPLPVWSITVLEGRTHAAVGAWKDGGRRDLDRDLARAMARAAAAIAPALGGMGASVTVASCPARAAHTRRRGVDLPALLARAAAGGLRDGGVDATARGLLRPGSGASRGAGDRERWRAAAPVVARGRRARGEALPVLLVDDVLTTGATLARAALALEAAADVPVGGLVLAVAPGVRRVAPGALL